MTNYGNETLSRDQVQKTSGPVVLEFGTDWCGYCSAAAPTVSEALSKYEGLRHLKVEDGPGRPLGRSFRVKLWPTLIFLQNGIEVSRVVRPGTKDEIITAAEALFR